MKVNFSRNVYDQKKNSYLAAALLQEVLLLLLFTKKPSCTVLGIPVRNQIEFSFGKTTPSNPRILTIKVRTLWRGEYNFLRGLTLRGQF